MLLTCKHSISEEKERKKIHLHFGQRADCGAVFLSIHFKHRITRAENQCINIDWNKKDRIDSSLPFKRIAFRLGGSYLNLKF